MFNHGKSGQGSALKIYGMNRLMGDGSAAWMDISETRTAALERFTPKDELGDFVSTTGQADQPNSSPSDGFSLY